MRSIFDVEPEEEPGAFTPEQMRGQLRRIAERQPEDVYGAGLPKGHVAAVLAGKAEPLPALLAMLELRAVDGGYASTVPEEPEPPYIPAWPDGSPFTRPMKQPWWTVCAKLSVRGRTETLSLTAITIFRRCWCMA